MRNTLALVAMAMTAGVTGLLETGCGSSSNGNGSAPEDGGAGSSGSSGVSSSSSSGSSGVGSSGSSGSSSGSSTSSSSGSSSGSSSSSSSSGSSSSSSGGDAGGCVFQTLVTGVVTGTSSTPIACSTALCGCTDNGTLIASVPGYF